MKQEKQKIKKFNFFDEHGKAKLQLPLLILIISFTVVYYYNIYLPNLNIKYFNYQIWQNLFLTGLNTNYNYYIYVSFLQLFLIVSFLSYIYFVIRIKYKKMAILGLESYKLKILKDGYLLKLKKFEMEDFEYVVRQENAFKQIFNINKSLYIERIPGTPNIKISIEKDL